MYTTCNHCHTSFKITAEQLKIAAGKVRCGHCNTVFDALLSLSDNFVDDNFSDTAKSPLLETQSAPQSMLLSVAGKAEEKPKNLSRHTEVIHKDEETIESTEQDIENAEPDVYFPEQFQATQPKFLFGWLILVVLLVLILASQHLHFNSYRFSQNPIYRPILEQLCQISNCPMPLQHDIDKIVVVEGTQVLPNEQLKEILDIKLRFRNQAEFVQSYPLLKITFSDTTGQMVAQRIFKPLEYLASQAIKTEAIQQGLQPQQISDVFIQIVDPAPQLSLGFEVLFL